jgi:hypothetical protein
MKEKRIKLDAQEIVQRIGCSLRHARRLRATDDERCYATVSDYGDEARTRPQDDNSALAQVRKILRAYSSGMSLAFCFAYKPNDYTNHPANMADILKALSRASEAIRNIETVAGFYHEDEPNGVQHRGEVTVFELAQRGGHVHRSYQEQVTAWAKKYGQPLNVTFWGRADGVIEEDENGAEIPAPPEETIITPLTPAHSVETHNAQRL